MRAIAVDDFVAPPAPHDIPRPRPAEGEVLVRVAASSLNGFDDVPRALADLAAPHAGKLLVAVA
jgi:NADPH:quinone reductase-like Zn-dependent oxidoreductase